MTDVALVVQHNETLIIVFFSSVLLIRITVTTVYYAIDCNIRLFGLLPTEEALGKSNIYYYYTIRPY